MPLPRASVLASLVAIPLALSGCASPATVSTSGLSGDRKAIATTIANFQSDAANNAPSKLCSNDLAPSLVRALSTNGRTCQDVLSQQLKSVSTFDLAVTAGEIRINGGTATAVVQDTQSGKSAHLDTLRLVKVGSAWKISGLT